MAYGCIKDDPEPFQRVGSKIVAELRRVGLNASWGGTAGHPIVVEAWCGGDGGKGTPNACMGRNGWGCRPGCGA